MAAIPAALTPVRSGAELDPRYPRQLLLHEGSTYLLTAMDGSMGAAPEEGLFDHDLRLLAVHRLSVGGRRPVGPAGAPILGERWVGVLGVRPRDGDPDGPKLPQDVIEVRIDRRVGCGLLERLTVTNHSMAARSADLELTIGTGFRDVTQLRHPSPLRGQTVWAWDARSASLTVRWTARDGARTVDRGLRCRILEGPCSVEPRVVGPETAAEPRFRFRFRQRLPAHGRYEVVVAYESLVDGIWRSPVDGRQPSAVLRRRDQERDGIRAGRPVVETPDSPVGAIVERALDDLLALRNWDLEGPDGGWIVNAGVPKYLGFFGRDSLISGRQAIAFEPDILRGALGRAAATQGRADVPERDEEPGRIVHEMRRGPLADLGIRPFGRYYGSLTGATAFVVGLADFWAWTGDRDATRRWLPTAKAGLAWAAAASERHPDRLLASQRRAPYGLRHQGWKDSDEAIRRPDGGPAPLPSAPLEEQGWWYRALHAAATLLDAFDDGSSADDCRAAAERVRAVVEERFWMSDAGTYAMALGPDGERIDSIGSDPLHLLAAGLPSPDRARRVVDRLFADDLWNGWGVRTLSSDHPAYDPFAYHLGSVWPVEAAAFAEGCRRYGHGPELEVVASGLFAAAAHCHQLRLPEVFAGHPRQTGGVPTLYPTTQTPQAWSAGAVLSTLAAMLGLEADAARGRLTVADPRLPAWLPVLRVRRLPVGRATVDLEFERAADGLTGWRVLDGAGRVHVAAADPLPEPVAR